jgi:uncharacterized membrane protein YcaP (DUF421 family)
MKKDEIHLADIHRLLLGQAPPEFLLEVFVRTLIIYVILLFIVRWLGKRMSGQLTIMEMAVMLTLGAIVSVPMQTPDRGLLQGVLLLLCAVAFQRGISWLGVKYRSFEDLTQGKCSLLVKNGILQLEQMDKDRISRQQLFAEFRRNQLFNLGSIDRAYLEACGLISVFKSAESKPGLSIYPPDDRDVLNTTQHATPAPGVQLLACVSCGNVVPEEKKQLCSICSANNWVNAIA